VQCAGNITVRGPKVKGAWRRRPCVPLKGPFYGPMAKSVGREDGEGAGSGGGGFGRGFLTDTWYFAALADELKRGRLARHEILGEPVLLGRAPDGAVFALRDVCPHRAAPLSAGRFTREPGGAASVECPYHGWRFAADGRCLAIPSLVGDQTFEPSRIQVRRYPVAESQGMVFVFVAADPRDVAPPPPPRFPEIARGRPRLVERRVFEVHVDHAVVGLMDPAHGPFVHRQWWWRTRASAHEKAKAFAPADEGFVMLRHAPSSNSRAYALLGGAPQTEITFRLPGLRWEHVVVGKRQVLALTCLTPIDHGRTAITQLVWSDHPVFALAGPLVRLATRRFLHQDGAMVDLQNQGLRYDPSLIWIDDADRQARWYQQLKREWIASRREGRPFVNPVEPAVLRWTS
jgi:phenylpropionate dioxygenase-like ring-hydroxylating dioxygenase large terminal subunit